MLRRLLFSAVLAVAGYYALFGGEYTVLDLQSVQQESESTRAQLDELRHLADSLALRADSLEHDDPTLERLARERFGMIRDGEILYRYTGEATAGEAEAGRF